MENTDLTREQLESVGGKYWEKNGMHRIYFNNVTEIIGLNVSRYNTGNISSASINGQRLSNSRAGEIFNQCRDSKFWYDLDGHKFHGRGFNSRSFTIEDILTTVEQTLIESVTKLLEV